MGHPNEDLIRQGYDAFSSGDMDTLRELFHPDIVWHASGRSQLAGDHQGVDTVLGLFEVVPLAVELRWRSNA